MPTHADRHRHSDRGDCAPSQRAGQCLLRCCRRSGRPGSGVRAKQRSDLARARGWRHFCSWLSSVCGRHIGRWPERGVHPGYPDVLEPGDATRVHAQQHLDAVPCPGCDLSGRDACVEPPGDARVPQIVGAAQQRRSELSGWQGESSGLLPDPPVCRGLDRVAVLAAEQPAVLGGTEPVDVLAQQGDELGRDRDVASGPAGGRLPGSALQPAGLVDPAVIGEIPPGRRAGVGEDQAPPAIRRQVARTAVP